MIHPFSLYPLVLLRGLISKAVQVEQSRKTPSDNTFSDANRLVKHLKFDLVDYRLRGVSA